MRVLHIVERVSASGWRHFRGVFDGLREAGVEIVLLNLAACEELRERLGESVSHHIELGRRHAYPLALPALRRAIRDQRPELVHAHEWVTTGYAALALMTLPGAPPLIYDRQHSRRLRGRAALLERLAAQKAEVVTCPSSWAASDARHRLPGEAGKVVTLLNGVDLESVAPDEREGGGGSAPPEPALREALREDALNIALVGRLHPVKGHGTALRALAHLLERGLAVRLICVGEGPERAGLERLARELGVAEAVRFPGRTERVGWLLSRCDLMWVPSELESFGLVAAEGMAAALPVIASRTGGLPDLIRDGETGWLIEPGDDRALAALTLELHADPEEGVRRGRRARERYLDHFTTAALTRRHLELYRSILERGGELPEGGGVVPEGGEVR